MSTDKPATRTPNPMRSLDSFFPSRFLKVEDLRAWKATEITPLIARVAEEEVQPEPNADKEWKLVLYFAAKGGGEGPKGYLVSAKADKESLKAATGASIVGALIGQRIRIYITVFRKKDVLRIDAQPVAQVADPQGKSATAPAEHLAPQPERAPWDEAHMPPTSSRISDKVALFGKDDDF